MLGRRSWPYQFLFSLNRRFLLSLSHTEDFHFHFLKRKISIFTFSHRRFPLSLSQTESFHFLIWKIYTFTFLNGRFPLSLSQVNEAKDVGKAFVALSTCMQGLKLELGEFKQIWMKYSEIWTVDRVQFIDEMEVERI